MSQFSQSADKNSQSLDTKNRHEGLFEQLPSWVHWIAQDADGAWWGYEVEPNLSHSGWYENEIGATVLIAKSGINPGWKETLSKRR